MGLPAEGRGHRSVTETIRWAPPYGVRQHRRYKVPSSSRMHPLPAGFGFRAPPRGRLIEGTTERTPHGRDHLRPRDRAVPRGRTALGQRARPRHRRRRVPGPGRPVRLRQVHRAAHARRPGGRRRGRDPDRRPGRHERAAEGPRHRDGVPELRAVPAHDRRREHGLRAEARRGEQGRRSRKPRRGGRQGARPGASTWTASRRRSPAASGSASRWAARSCASRRCS